jgi:hypothetical protein
LSPLAIFATSSDPSRGIGNGPNESVQRISSVAATLQPRIAIVFCVFESPLKEEIFRTEWEGYKEVDMRFLCAVGLLLRL